MSHLTYQSSCLMLYKLLLQYFINHPLLILQSLHSLLYQPPFTLVVSTTLSLVLSVIHPMPIITTPPMHYQPPFPYFINHPLLCFISHPILARLTPPSLVFSSTLPMLTPSLALSTTDPFLYQPPLPFFRGRLIYWCIMAFPKSIPYQPPHV